MSNFSNTEWLFLIVAIVFLALCLIGKAYQFGYAKGQKDGLIDSLKEDMMNYFTSPIAKIVSSEFTDDGICRMKFTTNRPSYFSKDA